MKKHILILCLLGNPYQNIEGGFQKTVYEIIEYFKEKDIKITIITSNISLLKDKFQQKYTNINFWELALNPKWIENQDQLYINADYLLDRIQQIISNYKDMISLIHSLQWINGYLATKINAQQKMIHIHSIISSSFERITSGFSVRSQYQRQCEDITFKTADLLISITEAEKNQLVNYYQVSPSKILIVGRTADIYYQYFHSIHNSQISKIDKLKYNSVLMQDNIPSNQKVFVYVGRIIEYKGIRQIIMAWHLLYTKYKEKMPPLWIIGGNEKIIYSFRDTLIKEISILSECERNHKIYWWGYMESYGISTILQKSHALIMHSAFEPGGRVILEAMTAGRPIIATPMGFAQTYIKDWFNGFQVEYQDINSLSAYMEFFIINEYLSSMMGINAKNTYDMLNEKWQYYKRLDELYHLDEIKNKSFPSIEYRFESLHPFLIDEFPYCDIKNDDTDLFCLINNSTDTIEEITKFESYIWKISCKDGIFFAKQVYNRINLKQLWNYFDKQKVHTIWMQYYAAALSTKYQFIISPLIISEKLFTYLLPYYEIVSDDHVYNIYPDLLKKLSGCEYGSCENSILPTEHIRYFKMLNKSIQYKHKYYTISIYAYELQDIFSENQTSFQLDDISTLHQCFEEINNYISSNKRLEYGLNYGKLLLKHIINYNTDFLLLPSSDIFIGELGQDEGMIYAAYYLEHHTFLVNSY